MLSFFYYMLLWSRSAPFLFIFFVFACQLSTSSHQESYLRADGLEIRKSLSEFPSLLPSHFYYQKSTILWLASFTSDPFLPQEEGIIILESEDTIKKVEQYYLRIFRSLRWQLLQHETKATTTLLMAESPTKHLCTVILKENPKKGEDKKTQIKFYIYL